MTEEEKRIRHRAYCKKWREKRTEEEKNKAIQSSIAWASKNAEKVKEYNKKSKMNNFEKNKATQKKWIAKNSEDLSIKKKIFYEKNKEKILNDVKKWKVKNKDKVIWSLRKRSIRTKHATPPWANQDYIKIWYKLAEMDSKEIGIKCHVDHIIPLNHPLVCGLHVEDNLQILTATDNLKKANKWVPD